MDAAARIMRLNDSDYLVKTMRSTASAVDLISESYSPSSLAIVADTSDYTLPPDCVRILSIVPITDGFEDVRFRPARHFNKHWMTHRATPDDDLSTVEESDAVFLYTTIGARTLRLAPTPQDAFNVEITYQFRPPRLLIYTTGTITVTNGSAAVVGVSSEWVSAGVRVPAELVVGASPVSAVRLDQIYPTVSAIGSNTTLTLARTYQGVTSAGSAYGLAMVPTLPEEHHGWLAQMAAAIMLRKVSVELSEASRKELEAQLTSQVTPEVTLRQSQESLAVEPFEIP